jgi:hypothetical protein
MEPDQNHCIMHDEPHRLCDDCPFVKPGDDAPP